MATVEERIAALETLATTHADKLQAVLELINSGPTVPWAHSVRGRLHAMAESQANADKLAEAAREVRRARRHTLSTLERVLLAGCAVAVAVSPYVVLLLH